MANIKSAKKRIRSNKRKTEYTKKHKESFVSVMKKIKKMDSKDIKKNLSSFISKIDSIGRRLFHPNKVNRIKSNVSKMANS